MATLAGLALAVGLPAGTARAQSGQAKAGASEPAGDADIDSLLREALGLPEEQAQAAAAAEREAADGWLPPEAAAAMLHVQRQIEAVAAESYHEIRRRLPPPVAERLDDVIALAQRARIGEMVAEALGLILALVLAVRLVRGRGDVVVSIEYPGELRGTFSIRASSRRPRGQHQGRILSPAAAQRAKARASASSRTEHHMVSRETQFRELHSGRYFVTADGFLQAPDHGNVLATRCETREVRVRRGRTVRAEFDFHPTTCTLVAKVNWNKEPAQDARVAVRGVASSLRFARSGSARIGVQLGRHTLVVGNVDRVAEMEVDVATFKPTTVEIDLANRDVLLFNGCPPAVEPYLLGDVAEAARALEREGQVEVAHLLLARQALQEDDRETAARYFERAGRLVEAAELHEAMREFAPAAALFERAGEFERSGDMLRQAGDLLKAGELFERANQIDLAVESYRKAGDRSRLVDALEKAGKPFEAAQTSIGVGDWPRAIRSLQQVGPQDDRFLEAADLLADAYQREGHTDLAIRTIERVVAFRGEEDVPLNDCDRLAKLLEEAREYERAIEVLEVIRRRDVTYPGVAPRIESLRKRITDAQAPAGGQAAKAEGFGGVRYDILEEIGRGGMGVVFKARDRRLGRVVALKRLTENLREHPKAVELFLREARAAAALNHPNIVTLYDAGQEGDTFYITMEFLEGSPLQVILKRKEKLSARDVARLGIQIATGLAYAEEQQIVHRDIKTANLFFTKKKVVKIMDFGLAKMIEEVRRSSTVIGGTPYYMAPEQSLGKSVDHRADIYALGVTFFELATGSVPFREGDVAYHHRHSPPPDPREQVPDLPEDLARLILHMLAKNPDERCGSGKEVAKRLQEILRACG